MANILVIEDNPNEARVLNDLITAAGYNVQVKLTGASALELLREKPQDVVVMSLNLWEQGGLDCIREVRSEYSTLPIMVVTEKGSEEIAVDALRAGASNYLPMRNVERGLETRDLLEAHDLGEVSILARKRHGLGVERRIAS
jgi:DNA-binding response OmpR family regulator